MGSIPESACNFEAAKGAITRLFWGAAFASVGCSSHQSASARIVTSQPSSLCRPGEILLADCLIGTKRASICSLNGFAVYRYGKHDKIELESGGLTYANRMYAGGGESQIYFTKGSYRYILYDRMISLGADSEGHSGKRIEAGLAVNLGSRTVSRRSCRTTMEPVIYSDLAQQILPSGFPIPR
jgi:hypothetical protein